MNDTSPATETILLNLLRDAPVWRKIAMVSQLNQMTATLAMSDLREQYPRANEALLRRLLAERILGHELAAKAYPLEKEI